MNPKRPRVPVATLHEECRQDPRRGRGGLEQGRELVFGGVSNMGLQVTGCKVSNKQRNLTSYRRRQWSERPDLMGRIEISRGTAAMGGRPRRLRSPDDRLPSILASLGSVEGPGQRSNTIETWNTRLLPKYGSPPLTES